jgi:hypothetical protein
VSIDPAKLLARIPAGLRDPLLETYREIASNFLERRWGPSELEGGKFSEVVYTIIDGWLKGTFPAGPSKPRDMRGACYAIESSALSGKPEDRSMRILIPRMLPPLYEIRNNRNVGHVGGDVDPNQMDAVAVYSIASWVMGELVRVFHRTSVKEAQEAVDALAERKLSLIWDPGTVKRVLDTKLTAGDQTLLLLHQSISWVAENDLLNSVEYSNTTGYRSKVIMKLHKARLIEYDKANKRAKISPKGSLYVEESVLQTRAKKTSGTQATGDRQP